MLKRLPNIFASIFILTILVSECSSGYVQERQTPQRYSVYHTRHHTEGGFKNLMPAPEKHRWRGLQWMFSRTFFRKEQVSDLQVEPIAASEIQESLATLKDLKDELRYWWLGHATVLVHSKSAVFLTDPIFSERASPVSFAGPGRLIPLPVAMSDLGRVDYVLISHNHYDHLDRATLVELDRLYQPVIYVPLGVAELVRSFGIQNVKELDWWQYETIGPVVISATPARHFSARSLFDRNETLWASWYVNDLASGIRFYHSGDTGYSPHFSEIQATLGAPDVSFIPIGAYNPRWLMSEVHVEPSESVAAFRDLQAKRMLPIHWGTFDLADEDLMEPPKVMLQKAKESGIDLNRIDQVHVGQKIIFKKE